MRSFHVPADALRFRKNRAATVTPVGEKGERADTHVVSQFSFHQDNRVVSQAVYVVFECLNLQDSGSPPVAPLLDLIISLSRMSMAGVDNRLEARGRGSRALSPLKGSQSAAVLKLAWFKLIWRPLI